MSELSLAPFASWAPLPGGLIVSRGAWYAVVRGPDACVLRDHLLSPSQPAPSEGSALLARLAGARVLAPIAPPSSVVDGEAGRSVEVCGVGPLAGLIADLLDAQTGPETSIDPAPTMTGGGPVTRRPELAPGPAVRLSIVVTDGRDDGGTRADGLAEVNRRFARAGRAWLLVDGRAVAPITVGPLIVPGATGCVECWWTRCAALTARPQEFRSLLTDRRAEPGGLWLRHAVASLAVALAAGWLCDPGPLSDPGRLGAAYELRASSDGLHTRRHPVVAVAGCPACTGAPSPVPAAGSSPLVRSSLKRLMVSSRAGPVARLTDTVGADGGWASAARGVSVDAVHATTRVIGGDGRARTRPGARTRALHEFCERLVQSEPSPGPPADDGTLVVLPDAPPADCPLWGQALPVVELATGASRSARASDFYLHPPECELGRCPGRPTTNGAAAGRGFWASCERGLFELLERDALMLAWRYGLPCPQWIGSVPGATALTVQFTDLSYLHGVPVIVCVVADPTGGPLVRAVGSAAGRDAPTAAARALGEATAVHSWLAEEPGSQDSTGVEPLTFTEFADNARYYRLPHRAGLLDRLLAADEDRSAELARLTVDPVPLVGSSQAVVRRLTRRLAGRGIDTYAADLTPPWLRAAGRSTVVVRSPALYPLELGPGPAGTARRLGWRVGGTAPVLLEPVPLT